MNNCLYHKPQSVKSLDFVINFVPMKKTFILSILLITAAIGLRAQNFDVVQGVTKNDQGQPIENVSVYVLHQLRHDQRFE